jgi:hypothetical protein
MRVEDFDPECDVASPADIDAALRRRHGVGVNSFWLSHGVDEFPSINILVKGGLAYVQYFPQRAQAGFASLAKEPGPKPGETSIFLLDPTEKVWVRNDALVPFQDALKAAQEFAISKALPKCIQWLEL